MYEYIQVKMSISIKYNITTSFPYSLFYKFDPTDGAVTRLNIKM